MNYHELRESIQAALIGRITPNLRSVYIETKNDLITLIFFYDKPPAEHELELASLANTEFIADFPSPEYKTDCKILTLPYPQRFPKDSLCVYSRYEPSSHDI